MAASAMGYVRADVENLKATELRLGLPGAEERNETATTRAGSKRSHAGENHEEEPKAAPPAAKAQVVGWPPVRSYRKSCFQQQASGKSRAAAAAEKKKKPEEVAVSVVAAAPPAAAGSAGSQFVKVSMDGAPYLRKIDLKMYKGYRELREALEAKFLGFSGDAAATVNPSDFAVTYEDKDGDLMLVGDVPFEMFLSTCKRMRIMKGSEARYLGSSME